MTYKEQTSYLCKIPILDFLVDSKLCNSRNEGKRLIEAGAVSVNGNKIDRNSTVTHNDVVKAGKHKYLRLNITECPFITYRLEETESEYNLHVINIGETDV